MAVKYEIGQKKGNLTILRMYHEKDRYRDRLYIETKCDCGIIEATLAHNLVKKIRCKKCEMKSRTKNVVGLKKHHLTIIERINEKIDGKESREYICRCDCGKITRIAHSTFGRTKTCGCKRCLTGKDHWNFKGYEEITSCYWWGIVNNADKRYFKFNLRIEDAWKQFIKQDRKCALTGVPIYFGRSHKNETTASLDRIDSKKHYCKSNIQWVHKTINKIKWDYTMDEFIDWCKKVAEYNK